MLFGSDLALCEYPFDAMTHAAVVRLGHWYDLHWRFLETNEEETEHPRFPIGGRRKVDAIGLPDDVLHKLYVENAKHLIPQLRG